jgi:hypothetical protein
LIEFPLFWYKKPSGGGGFFWLRKRADEGAKKVTNEIDSFLPPLPFPFPFWTLLSLIVVFLPSSPPWNPISHLLSEQLRGCCFRAAAAAAEMVAAGKSC